MAEEGKIEQRFRKKAAAKGGWVIKFTPVGLRGLPDRIVLIKGGRIAFIEFKAPGQKPRPLQLKRKRQLEGFGFACYICDSNIVADRILDELFGNEVVTDEV